MAGAIIYLAAVCAFVGACLYAALCKLDPLDDPLGDTPHGDWPALPADFKTLFHDSPNITGRQ